jgi:hypothetical protein
VPSCGLDPLQGPLSLHPVAMDGRSYSFGSSPHGAVAPPPLPERPARTGVLPPLSELPPARGPERPSAASLRGAFRQTVRAVTPEPAEAAFHGLDAAGASVSQVPRGLPSVSPQTSPRSIPAGTPSLPARRQGVVFNDSFPASFDSTSSSPPLRPTSFRPRTHTMDGAFRQQLAPAIEGRNRMGSFSSAASHTVTDDMKLPSFQSPFEP